MNNQPLTIHWGKDEMQHAVEESMSSLGLIHQHINSKILFSTAMVISSRSSSGELSWALSGHHRQVAPYSPAQLRQAWQPQLHQASWQIRGDWYPSWNSSDHVSQNKHFTLVETPSIIYEIYDSKQNKKIWGALVVPVWRWFCASRHSSPKLWWEERPSMPSRIPSIWTIHFVDFILYNW